MVEDNITYYGAKHEYCDNDTEYMVNTLPRWYYGENPSGCNGAERIAEVVEQVHPPEQQEDRFQSSDPEIKCTGSQPPLGLRMYLFLQ